MIRTTSGCGDTGGFEMKYKWGQRTKPETHEHPLHRQKKLDWICWNSLSLPSEDPSLTSGRLSQEGPVIFLSPPERPPPPRTATHPWGPLGRLFPGAGAGPSAGKPCLIPLRGSARPAQGCSATTLRLRSARLRSPHQSLSQSNAAQLFSARLWLVGNPN